MRRKKRQPDVAAGRLAIALGVVCLTAAIFVPKLDAAHRCFGSAMACVAFSWGLKEFAAASKWKQESEDERYATSAREIRESKIYEKMEKCGSMHNVMILLVWIFLFLAVAGAIFVSYLFWIEP